MTSARSLLCDEAKLGLRLLLPPTPSTALALVNRLLKGEKEKVEDASSITPDPSEGEEEEEEALGLPMPMPP